MSTSSMSSTSMYPYELDLSLLSRRSAGLCLFRCLAPFVACKSSVLAVSTTALASSS